MKTLLYNDEYECEKLDTRIEANFFKKPKLLGKQDHIDLMFENMKPYNYTPEDTVKIYSNVDTIRKAKNHFVFSNKTFLVIDGVMRRGMNLMGIEYPSNTTIELNCIEKIYYVHNDYRNVYFHFLIEELPIIIHIHEHDPTAPILCSINTTFAKDILSLLNISNPIVDYKVEKLYKVSTLYIPNVLPCGFPAKSTIQRTISHFKKTVPFLPQQNNAILIYRKETIRKILNFEEVLHSLKTNFPQFKWVVFDNLNIKTTIQLFNSAKVVVAPHGAGLSNMIFCHPGTKIFEFMPIYFPNPCYNHLAEVCELDHHFIAVEDQGTNEANQMNINVEEVLKHIQPYI